MTHVEIRIDQRPRGFASSVIAQSLGRALIRVPSAHERDDVTSATAVIVCAHLAIVSDARAFSIGAKVEIQCLLIMSVVFALESIQNLASKPQHFFAAFQ